MPHQRVTPDFPTGKELGTALRDAMADAQKTGRIVRAMSFDHKGNPSFEYGPPTIEHRPPPVDPDILRSQWTYVYIIGADAGPVKIGISASPEVRLSNLQTSYPYRLGVLAKFRGGEEIEARLHALFANERLLGEWFQRSSRICKFIDMIACGVGLSTVIERVKHDTVTTSRHAAPLRRGRGQKPTSRR